MVARNDLECGHCGGEDFYCGVLDARLKFSIYRKADVQCSVCLSCGYVFTYVDDAALERLRSLRAKEPADA
jgi:hypothetical protein